MIVIHGQKNIYFDCDDTLVLWSSPSQERAINIGGFQGVPHVHHINALKNHKEDGCTIIVWSAAGADWAECVVKALGLEPWVDACLCKPDLFYDDLPTDQVLEDWKRRYIND